MRYFCLICKKTIDTSLKFNPKYYCPHGAPTQVKQCLHCGNYLFVQDDSDLPRCTCHINSHNLKLLSGKQRFKGLSIKEAISLHLHQIIEGNVIANGQVTAIARLLYSYYIENGERKRLTKIRCIPEDYKALKHHKTLKKLLKKGKVKLSTTKSSKIYTRI